MFSTPLNVYSENVRFHEKLKKLSRSKEQLKAEKSEKKLGQQNFPYDIQQVIEPATTLRSHIQL